MRQTTAQCAGRADLFDSTLVHDHIRARAYCSACPMVSDCLLDALQQARNSYRNTRGAAVPDGTWGGLLWRAGHVVAHPNEAAACGTDSGYYRHRRQRQQPCERCKSAHAAAHARRAAVARASA